MSDELLVECGFQEKDCEHRYKDCVCQVHLEPYGRCPGEDEE
ncbi:MAG: hypothetical protein WC365_01180 [Candidatus Babeliales bacterium]